MARSAGLKIELILNLTLLLSAALLFIGILLLKLTERELLRERSARALEVLEMTAARLDVASAEYELRQLLPAGLDPGSLVLVDENLQPFGSGSAKLSPVQDEALRRSINTRQTSVHISFDPFWFFRESSEDRLLVAVPLARDDQSAGGIFAAFSLRDVRAQLRDGLRLALGYAGLYGGVLFLFGIFLLTRNVIRPVTGLTIQTRKIAGGDLDSFLAPEGPREIAELGHSYNEMILALKDSRQETALQLSALEKANAELQRTRDDLVRSAKLASVGHLAAGMAHEIGNPLGASLGYLELMKNDLDPRMCDLVDRTLAELGRIDRLVKDLMDYSAPRNDLEENLDAAAVAREAADLLRQQGGLEGIQLRDDLPAALPAVTMARHKLLQVFVNLLLNARDAMAHEGTIVLRGCREGSAIRIEVQDDGPGIPAEVLPHIFDPFFTTKGPGKGRGLGLSVCHRIIEEAGGRMEVRSEPGSGSSFFLHLTMAEIKNEP